MLKGLLQKHPGEISVQLIIRPNQESQVSIKLDEKISAHPALIDEFEEERFWRKPSFHYHQTPEILKRHSRVAAY